MDRLLTAQEIADRLGVKTQWVWAKARTGEIPHVRLGRYRRFRKSTIEEWLGELEADSTASHLPSPAATDPMDQPTRRNGSRSGVVQSARRRRT